MRIKQTNFSFQICTVFIRVHFDEESRDFACLIEIDWLLIGHGFGVAQNRRGREGDSLRNWKFLGVRKKMPFLQRMGGRRRSLEPIGGNRQWAGRGSRHCSKPHTVLSPSSSNRCSTRVEVCNEYQE
ncbi:hypothetical protein WR25_12351 [Diploscapter pachys]|uniref:Uncharacterized protein n=1 Tax=Diploscapter pachys TaxID=2018661 RepID=A0A2A2LBL7_9BILA|nr:hypothetical protein WR25_12351 [Diploscapter pachys]